MSDDKSVNQETTMSDEMREAAIDAAKKNLMDLACNNSPADFYIQMFEAGERFANQLTPEETKSAVADMCGFGPTAQNHEASYQEGFDAGYLAARPEPTVDLVDSKVRQIVQDVLGMAAFAASQLRGDPWVVIRSVEDLPKEPDFYLWRYRSNGGANVQHLTDTTRQWFADEYSHWMPIPEPTPTQENQ